jgi:hypothetical protein
MSEPQRVIRGWVVQVRTVEHLLPDSFLSLKTGELEPEPLATLFSSREAAEAYAAEFGFTVGVNVEAVKYEF